MTEQGRCPKCGNWTERKELFRFHYDHCWRCDAPAPKPVEENKNPWTSKKPSDAIYGVDWGTYKPDLAMQTQAPNFFGYSLIQLQRGARLHLAGAVACILSRMDGIHHSGRHSIELTIQLVQKSTRNGVPTPFEIQVDVLDPVDHQQCVAWIKEARAKGDI